MARDVETQVPGEEPRDPFHVQRAVGEVRARVWRALDDPDLARSSVRVVEPARMADVGDRVRAAVNEEQRPRLECAQDVERPAGRQRGPGAQPEHETGQPDEGPPWELARAADALD